MSRARAFAQQDTTLSQKSATGNTGLAPIIQVGSPYYPLDSRKYWQRGLIKFSLSSLTGTQIVTDQSVPDPRTDSSVTAYLYMFNAAASGDVATSFDIDIYPLTREWNEGTGLDLDEFSETGQASTVSAQSGVAWSTSGGDYTEDASSATMNFDHGEENLKADVTTIFKDWMNGNTGNFGLVLRLRESQEAATGSLSAQGYEPKKFYARETNTTRRPYIQLEWDGAVKDDRNFIEFNGSGSLFFYNIQNGQLKDLDGISAFPGDITLSGLSGTSYSGITTMLTAARESKGVYRANIASFPLTANNYSAFKDNWYLSASPTANYTFVFTAIDPTSGYDNFVTSQYRVNLRNLRGEYEKGTKSRIRVHVKDSAVSYTALTAGTTAINNFTTTDGTYEIREKATDLVEVSAVNLSYDKNGNFFDIDTNMLYIGVEYKVVLKMNFRGETFWMDKPDVWNFTVR